jgi:hypothetical protein
MELLFGIFGLESNVHVSLPYSDSFDAGREHGASSFTLGSFWPTLEWTGLAERVCIFRIFVLGASGGEGRSWEEGGGFIVRKREGTG